MDRDTFCKLLRHYGIPPKIADLIRKSYAGMTSKVVHEGRLTKEFEVKTGVRQGCLLSPFLFLLAIDWIMKSATTGKKNGIQWTMWKQLDDLDFADDIALLSHSHQQMKEKIGDVWRISRQTGLNLHKGKTKLLKSNTTMMEPLLLESETIEEVESFTYLGSVVDKLGGTDADIKTRICKARTAFIQLNNLWKSKEIGRRTKLRLFNSNVKSVLLYGAETWRTTKGNSKKIQTFINTCLRKIMNIRWPEKISNINLWQRTNQNPIDTDIMQRKWRWLGHTLRKPQDNITRTALTWNPQGKRRKGRPRNTWRRDLSLDMADMGMGWPQLVTAAQDRRNWRLVVDGLTFRRRNGP